MTYPQKLEYIHSILQECSNGYAESLTPFMINTSIEFVEDIRESFFDKYGNTIRPNPSGYSTKAYIETDLEYAKRIQEIK